MADDAAQDAYDNALYGATCAAMGFLSYVYRNEFSSSCVMPPAETSKIELPPPWYLLSAISVVMISSVGAALEAYVVWTLSGRISQRGGQNYSAKSECYAQKSLLTAISVIFSIISVGDTKCCLCTNITLGSVCTYCLCALWLHLLALILITFHHRQLRAYKLNMCNAATILVSFVLLHCLTVYYFLSIINIMMGVINFIDSNLKMFKAAYPGHNHFSKMKKGIFIGRWIAVVTEIFLPLIFLRYLYSFEGLAIIEKLLVCVCLLLVVGSRSFSCYEKRAKMNHWP